jgi:alpha-tubulin suppressor-like RCC1 family protein
MKSPTISAFAAPIIVTSLLCALLTEAPMASSAQTATHVIGWGDNTSGQVSVPADLTDVVYLAAGSAHGLALRMDGTVVAWGDNTSNAGSGGIPGAVSAIP